MSDDFDSFIDGLMKNDVEALKARQTKAAHEYTPKTFTCEGCGGTGRWSGGVNRHGNAKCNVCNGRGFLTTSKADRMKKQAQRKDAKARKASEAQLANQAHGDGFLLRWLGEIETWNTFAASLLDQHRMGRAWSDAQVEACRKMYKKMQARKVDQAERQAAAPVVDAARIQQMFDDALANGKKRRALHAGRFGETDPETGKPTLLNKVVMTPARAPRRDVWVKVDGEFCGGIGDDGKLKLNRAAPEWLEAQLTAIAADPDAQCRLYGQRTGVCSCCGRELTRADSIELGIGPVCREKWGLA